MNLKLDGQRVEAQRPAACDEQAQAACDHHDGERHDEVVEADPGDQEAHEGADRDAGSNGDARR